MHTLDYDNGFQCTSARPACAHFYHISEGKFCYFRAGRFLLQVTAPGWLEQNVKQLQTRSWLRRAGDAVSAAAVSVQDASLTLTRWESPHPWPSHANASMHVVVQNSDAFSFPVLTARFDWLLPTTVKHEKTNPFRVIRCINNNNNSGISRIMH